MQRFLFLLPCLVFWGCTLSYDAVETSEKSKSSEMAKMSGMSRRFLSLRLIHEGMTKKEVQAALGTEIVVGYELAEPETGQYRPITLQNPYRAESLQKGTQRFDIDYYIVGINQADDQVTDDELVPLVFQKEKLVGMGWIFLKKEVLND